MRYELSPEFQEKKFKHDDFFDKSLWMQALYEFSFEALGYTKNKVIMKKLAQSVSLEYLKLYSNYHNFSKIIESILFHIAGLIQFETNNVDEESEYVKELKEIWQNLKYKYDGKYFDETQWHFLGQRPQNFPTLRMYAGSKIAHALISKNLITELIYAFESKESSKLIINSLRSFFILRTENYWKNHFIFEKLSKTEIQYAVGMGRADEIMINVILPFLWVYFNVFGMAENAKKVLKIYNSYEQKSQNMLVKEVSEALNFSKAKTKTIFSQGIIELYKSYCVKSKCSECEIGKRVFS